MRCESITFLEDLANELIYEIFEYLDDYHVYQAFFQTNDRFRTLLSRSTLPIRLDLGSMSKLAFHRYNTDVLLSNPSRIHSLRISNPFLYNDYPLALPSKTSLTTLILENVEFNYLCSLFVKFRSLPYLTSLSLTTLNRCKSNCFVYSEVFDLPALKYCQLLLNNDQDVDVLPVATKQYSSIEYLILRDPVYLQQLDALLSYLPQLRHFSFPLEGDYVRKKFSGSHILKHLTHLTLELVMGRRTREAQFVRFRFLRSRDEILFLYSSFLRL